MNQKYDEKKFWAMKPIKNPKCIIYDFETDTSSGIHRPNLCVVNVLHVSDDHDYMMSLKKLKYLKVMIVVRSSATGY